MESERERVLQKIIGVAGQRLDDSAHRTPIAATRERLDGGETQGQVWRTKQSGWFGSGIGFTTATGGAGGGGGGRFVRSAQRDAEVRICGGQVDRRGGGKAGA